MLVFYYFVLFVGELNGYFNSSIACVCERYRELHANGMMQFN